MEFHDFRIPWFWLTKTGAQELFFLHFCCLRLYSLCFQAQICIQVDLVWNPDFFTWDVFEIWTWVKYDSSPYSPSLNAKVFKPYLFKNYLSDFFLRFRSLESIISEQIIKYFTMFSNLPTLKMRHFALLPWLRVLIYLHDPPKQQKVWAGLTQPKDEKKTKKKHLTD